VAAAWPGFDASGSDEAFDVGGVEADVPSYFVEGDAAFSDQPTHEAGRGAESFGDLFDVQHAVHFGQRSLIVLVGASYSDGEFRAACGASSCVIGRGVAVARAARLALSARRRAIRW
jgi:hypothetical protein